MPVFPLTDTQSIIDRLILFTSEFCGTAILVFIGCMSCVGLGPYYKGLTHTEICLCFGLAVMVSIQTFGHISGGHINPVVTIAAAVLGDLALIEVPVYFLGQFTGAFAGYAVLMTITPLKGRTVYKAVSNALNATEISVGRCSPWVNVDITPTQGLFVEFLITLILVLICCSVWDFRNAHKHDSVPIKFGLTIAVLALAGGPFTGGNMNPARSLAPAAWHGDWKNHWVYWVGSILSAFVGAGFYRTVFSKDRPAVDEHIVI